MQKSKFSESARQAEATEPLSRAKAKAGQNEAQAPTKSTEAPTQGRQKPTTCRKKTPVINKPPEAPLPSRGGGWGCPNFIYLVFPNKRENGTTKGTLQKSPPCRNSLFTWWGSAQSLAGLNATQRAARAFERSGFSLAPWTTRHETFVGTLFEVGFMGQKGRSPRFLVPHF